MINTKMINLLIDFRKSKQKGKKYEIILLAPHTSGPRDVPRCGALSLLQKDAALQGGSSRNRCRLNVKMCDLRACLPGAILLLILHGN
jgi:hypothetical protein